MPLKDLQYNEVMTLILSRQLKINLLNIIGKMMNEPMDTSGKKLIKPPGIPLTSSGSGTSTSLADLIKQIQLKLDHFANVCVETFTRQENAQNEIKEKVDELKALVTGMQEGSGEESTEESEGPGPSKHYPKKRDWGFGSRRHQGPINKKKFHGGYGSGYGKKRFFKKH